MTHRRVDSKVKILGAKMDGLLSHMKWTKLLKKLRFLLQHQVLRLWSKEAGPDPFVSS